MTKKTLFSTCALLMFAVFLGSAPAFARGAAGETDVESPLYKHISDLSANGMQQKVWRVGDPTVAAKSVAGNSLETNKIRRPSPFRVLKLIIDL